MKKDISKNNIFTIAGLLLFMVMFSDISFAQKGKDPSKMSFKGFFWPNQTPGECPFEPSDAIKGI